MKSKQKNKSLNFDYSVVSLSDMSRKKNAKHGISKHWTCNCIKIVPEWTKTNIQYELLFSVARNMVIWVKQNCSPWNVQF